MANFDVLKAAIAAVIKANGNNEITGPVLQSALLSMVNGLGTNFQYAGLATPATAPGNPDANVFYLAVQQGTYSNFGGYVHDGRTVRIFRNIGGAWSVTNTGILASHNTYVLSKDEYGLAAFLEDIVVERLPGYIPADLYKPDGNIRKFSIQNIDAGEVANNVVIYRENDAGVLVSYMNNTIPSTFNEFDPLWISNGGNILIGNGKLRFRIKMKRIPTTRLYPMFETTRISESVFKRMLVQYQVQQNSFDIEQLKADTSAEPLELVPTDSKLDIHTPVTSSSAGSWWVLRFPTLETSLISKVDNYINVRLDRGATGTTNPAFWALEKLSPSLVGKPVHVKFEVKANESTNPITFIVGGTADLRVINPTSEWVTHEFDTTVLNLYPDRRIMFYIDTLTNPSQTLASFSIRRFSITVQTGLAQKVDEIDNRVELLETSAEIKSLANIENIPSVLAKLMAILFTGTGIVRLAIFGDSWTQGVGNVATGLIGYIKYFTRIMQAKYGYAGLGWFDFGYSNNTDMKCADDEAVTLTKTGTFTYRSKTADCLGVSIAHTVFPNGGSYNLDFIDPNSPVDKAVVRFHGGAQFTVSVNGGTPEAVSGNPSLGWQEHEVTGAITSLNITATADNSIILGVYLTYGNTGVIVNKFGNRGMNTVEPNAVNIDNWKEGLELFDLDFFAVLLATNDRTQSRAPQVVADNIENILNNAKSVFPNADFACISPSNNKRTELYTIKQYSDAMYNMAVLNNFVFVSLLPIFGTTDQINYLGTFNDDVHPTKMGGYMIGEYLFKKLFEYKQYEN